MAAFTTFTALNMSENDPTKVVLLNRCEDTVWPGVRGTNGKVPTTGFELRPNSSFTVSLGSEWTGRIWPRTSCSADASGRFYCDTGDCGTGSVACRGKAGASPDTAVDFSLTATGARYDISLEDGFNVAVSVQVVPAGGYTSATTCQPTGCTAMINAVCPPELRKNGSQGQVIGCKSACSASRKAEYCRPNMYTRFFKEKCPKALTYKGDKSTVAGCRRRTLYRIIFC